MRIARIFFVFLIISTFLFRSTPSVEAEDRVYTFAESLKTNIVKIITETENNNIYNGFGIVIGETSIGTLIVTANHLVRPKTNSKVKKITIGSLNRPGESFIARLHPFHDAELDIGLITARISMQGVKASSMGCPNKLKVGDSLWYIGRLGEWYIPTVPGAVQRLSGKKWIFARNLTIALGSSGGAIIGEYGIVGMIVRHSPDNITRILRIDAIRELIFGQNLPWYPVRAKKDEVCVQYFSGNHRGFIALVDEYFQPGTPFSLIWEAFYPTPARLAQLFTPEVSHTAEFMAKKFFPRKLPNDHIIFEEERWKGRRANTYTITTDELKDRIENPPIETRPIPYHPVKIPLVSGVKLYGNRVVGIHYRHFFYSGGRWMFMPHLTRFAEKVSEEHEK